MYRRAPRPVTRKGPGAAALIPTDRPQGLAIYREFGPPEDPGVVFFLSPGLLEVSGHRFGPPGHSMIWVQVRDVHAERARLAAAGVPVIRRSAKEPWGLIEIWIQDPDGWIQDPDGIQIALVEFLAQSLELVLDRRLGPPGHLAAGSLAVLDAGHGTQPPAGTMPVMFRVPAPATVIKVDGVAAAPAPAPDSLGHGGPNT